MIRKSDAVTRSHLHVSSRVTPTRFDTTGTGIDYEHAAPESWPRWSGCTNEMAYAWDTTVHLGSTDVAAAIITRMV
jgi:hypothetical protein